MLNAFDDLHQILAIMAVILVIGLALTIGRGPERLCALILLFDTFGIVLLITLFDQPSRLWMVHAKAILVLLAYGGVLWRWPHRWLILLAALQIFAVILHLSAWVDGSILIMVNSLLLNGVGWLMMIVLVAATIGGAVQRHDAKRGAKRRS